VSTIVDHITSPSTQAPQNAMSAWTVVKRDGSSAHLDLVKLRRTIARACAGWEGCHPQDLEGDVWALLRDGMSTETLHRTITQAAVERTSVEAPNWQYVAARLHVMQLYKSAASNRGYESFGYGDFFSLIQRATQKGLYGSYILEGYSGAEIEELGAYIVPERDELFHYMGIYTLASRYLIRDFDGGVLELPQELFMGVAMHLALQEEDKLHWAKQFYDVLSRLEMTVATPTLSNARKPMHQLSSCFIDTVDDNLWSIYHVNSNFAQVSKLGGGMGIYVGKVRSRGSSIRNFPGASGGVIPWIKNYNNTALSCNQLGVRNGAVAIYLDVWHKDILDFLNLKTNNGDDRMKAHDIFPGVCIPDLFMRKVQARETWNLFDPHEVRQVMGWSLEDVWGEEWERRYEACVDHPDLSREELPAIDIMKRILTSTFETGTPFIFFRDTANRMNPNKHAGMIYCSNLCTEIMQNMSPGYLSEEQVVGGDVVTKVKPGDFVVCNLSSLNLGRCHSYEDIQRVVRVQMRMMDNVIDLNLYPVQQAHITNHKYRAVGLGTSGYHQYLAQHGIPWESEKHIELADKLYEHINYCAIRASMEIAREKGPYTCFAGSDWQTGAYFDTRAYRDEKWTQLRTDVARHGVRNGWMVAIAPTSTTSLIAGSTAGIDPVFQRFFVEEKKNAFIPQTAPNLSPSTFWLYKEAHQIDQLFSIRAAGKRQRHIDQSQSFNLYITPDITAPAFLDLFIQAWQNGLKTTYYVRNQSLTVEDCVACSS
jgi:ribonucleoside-diphosphate reductase alpha chain